MYEYNGVIYNMMQFKTFEKAQSENGYLIIARYNETEGMVFVYAKEAIRDFIYRRIQSI